MDFKINLKLMIVSFILAWGMMLGCKKENVPMPLSPQQRTTSLQQFEINPIITLPIGQVIESEINSSRYAAKLSLEAVTVNGFTKIIIRNTGKINFCDNLSKGDNQLSDCEQSLYTVIGPLGNKFLFTSQTHFNQEITQTNLIGAFDQLKIEKCDAPANELVKIYSIRVSPPWYWFLPESYKLPLMDIYQKKTTKHIVLYAINKSQSDKLEGFSIQDEDGRKWSTCRDAPLVPLRGKIRVYKHGKIIFSQF